jgi:hypothetical protein
MLAVVTALAALTVIWAALPLRPAAVPEVVLGLAILAAIVSVLELPLRDKDVSRAAAEPIAARLTRYLVTAVRSLPWAEAMSVLVLLLEAEHKPRPWHTAILVVAVIGYLMAVHLAETGAGSRVLRAQLAPLAAGAGLTAVAAGAGEFPGLPAGPAAAAVRIIAAAAAVAAAAMVIPVWMARDDQSGGPGSKPG